ncbi:MAG: hypothetical protein JXN64_08365 [Spirochaetes bacterium]|nr:hypothetical protein [Spirochaetota bacterium]
MNKKAVYIAGVSLLFIIVILVEIFSPKEPDWTMSFSRYSREPYGNYLMYNLLKTLFPRKEITTLHDPLYVVLKGKSYRRHNYLLLNDRCIFDELDSRELLRFVSDGNNAFIAANNFSDSENKWLAEALGIETGRYAEILTAMRVRFVNSRLKNREYNLKQEGGAYYFSGFDRESTVILSINERKDPVYLRVKYGRGFFYLSTVPLAFTNYCIVSPQSDYPFTALSYLPEYNTVWDEFYKIGRLEAQTPLRFILNREPLRWAYILGLTTIMLVIISGAKRKQRIIPVIHPVINTTLDFVTTVGSLYYQNSDHRNLSQKKISHFLEYIRSRLYLDTRELNDVFFEKLASKTGLTFNEIQKTFALIGDIRQKEHVTESELVLLNSKIDNVYRSDGIR